MKMMWMLSYLEQFLVGGVNLAEGCIRDIMMRLIAASSILTLKSLEEEDVIIPKADLKLLLSLIPDWVKIVPRGLDYMFYGTGSYEGDLEIKERIDKIREEMEG
jgi:hypothetical protein